MIVQGQFSGDRDSSQVIVQGQVTGDSSGTGLRW